MPLPPPSLPSCPLTTFRLCPQHLRVHALEGDAANAPPSAMGGPAYAAWRGGSIFAASPEFGRVTVSKAEYEEYGHRLCRLRNLQPASAS